MSLYITSSLASRPTPTLNLVLIEKVKKKSEGIDFSFFWEGGGTLHQNS